MIEKLKCHYLNGVKSESIPNHLLFLDTESYIKDYKTFKTLPFRMGWTCFINRTNKKNNNNEEWKFFTSKKLMIEYILSKTYKKVCLFVFAHNIFHDMKCLSLFSYLQKKKWTVNILIDSGKTSFLKIRKDQMSIAFISTTNFFSYSLKELGQNIGLYKDEIDFDNTNHKELKKYCRQDVNIIKQIMLDFFDYIIQNKLGRFCITAPAQAMYCFRFRFMKHKIFPTHDPNVMEIERKSYFGGRTECFRIGDISKHNIRIYDINSMYPFCMKNGYFPVYAKTILYNVSKSQLKKILKYYCVVGEVKLKTNKPIYPFRYKKRLIFPTGIFSTTLATPEIEYALNHNHIKSINKLIIYYKQKIFFDYVDFFYKERKKYKKLKNHSYVTLIKLLLNSLYGKFGQRGYQQNISINYEENGVNRNRIIDYETGKIYWETQLINSKIIDSNGQPPIHSFVSIAAHVTSYARIYLYDLIKISGFKNTFYVDTDSLFVNKQGEYNLKKYIHPSELGKLKLEKQPTYVKINGLKDYTIDDFIKLKGIRKNAKNIGINKYKQDQFESLKSAIKNNHIDEPYVKIITKELKRKYVKGIVQKSGKVKPFHFSSFSELVHDIQNYFQSLQNH